MTTEQTALQRLKEVCEAATPGPWVFKDGLTWLPTASGGIEHDDSAICHGKNGKFIATSRDALPALIEYCEKLEQLAELVEPAKEISLLEDQGWLEEHELYVSNFKKLHIAATAAVEAARARLEEVCPKK